MSSAVRLLLGLSLPYDKFLGADEARVVPDVTSTRRTFTNQT